MFVQVLFWVMPLLFLGRRDQCFRIIALQQQLDVYERQWGGKRLRLTDEDRRFWVMLRRSWPGWRDALMIVKPGPVVAAAAEYPARSASAAGRAGPALAPTPPTNSLPASLLSWELSPPLQLICSLYTSS